MWMQGTCSDNPLQNYFMCWLREVWDGQWHKYWQCPNLKHIGQRTVFRRGIYEGQPSFRQLSVISHAVWVMSNAVAEHHQNSNSTFPFPKAFCRLSCNKFINTVSVETLARLQNNASFDGFSPHCQTKAITYNQVHIKEIVIRKQIKVSVCIGIGSWPEHWSLPTLTPTSQWLTSRKEPNMQQFWLQTHWQKGTLTRYLLQGHLNLELETLLILLVTQVAAVVTPECLNMLQKNLRCGGHCSMNCQPFIVFL